MWLAIGITAAFLLIVFGAPRLMAGFMRHHGARCIRVEDTSQFIPKEFCMIDGEPYRVLRVDHKNKFVVCMKIKDAVLAAKVMEFAKNHPPKES